MNKYRRGSIIIILLPVVMGLFLLSLLVVDVGRASAALRRSQTVADASVDSSLKMRVEGLEAIAQNWSLFEDFFGEADEEDVFVESDRWPSLAERTSDLRESLSGYQGRVSSVITALAQGNDFPRDHIEITEDSGARLGVSAQPQWIRDEAGNRTLMPALWYRRDWEPERTLADPIGRITHRFNVAVPLIGARLGLLPMEAWLFSKSASARLRWDVSRADPWILARGNGGFPRNWAEAVDEGRLAPHRLPYYWVEGVYGE